MRQKKLYHCRYLYIVSIGQFTNKGILKNRAHLTELQINRSRHKYFCCSKGFAYFWVKQLLPDAKQVCTYVRLVCQMPPFSPSGLTDRWGRRRSPSTCPGNCLSGGPLTVIANLAGGYGDLPLLRFVLSFCNFHLFLISLC